MTDLDVAFNVVVGGQLAWLRNTPVPYSFTSRNSYLSNDESVIHC